MMDFSNITDNDIVAGLLAGLGGLVRLLLNVDPEIPRWKQFLFLFIAAMPTGWMAYVTAVSYGFEKAAFPIGFFSGIMALSIVSIVARDGAGALLAAILGRK